MSCCLQTHMADSQIIAQIMRENFALKDELEALKRSRAALPTQDAYVAACRALEHWRAEAERLGKLAGEMPRQMEHR